MTLNKLNLSAPEQQNWKFVGGPWKQDADGTISPNSDAVDENLAFHTASTYKDFEAEFEFRWDSSICEAGLLFRATDPRHYYVAHFPCTGQQYRAEHFWAAISKMDDSGIQKVLKMELVHGVPSEIGMWHKAKLAVKGNEIRLWVDGRPFPVVHDDTHSQAGYVGLQSYNGIFSGQKSSFRGLRINGDSQPAQPWDESIQPVRNWFYPTRDTTFGDVHHVNSIARAGNGDLLLKMGMGKEFHGSKSTVVLLRSKDNGRTWYKPQRMGEENITSDDHLSAVLFSTRSGKLFLYRTDYNKPVLTISRASSNDNGQTWSEFASCGEIKLAKDPEQGWMYQPPLELQDGTLLWFGIARSPQKLAAEDGVFYENIRLPGAMNFCLRSTDGGKSWTGPINTDGRNPRPEHLIYAKDHHPSEISGGQTKDGKIVALIRPIDSPWVWETWSEDGGQTWLPWARGPFGLWANTAIVRTKSGALLIAGRHPAMAVQMSQDDGMTWQCYRLDTSFWANGSMYEVEPDVVLFASTAGYTDPHVRAFLLRVTPDGLEPVRVNA